MIPVTWGVKMKIVLVSDYLNQHRLSLCEALAAKCESFRFVACDSSKQEGHTETAGRDYAVGYSGEGIKTAEEYILSADAVIYGECPDRLIDIRAEKGLLCFLYSERLFKKGAWRRFMPHVKRAVTDRFVKHKNDNFYVLCASAYLPYELSLTGFPADKCFRWGIFPKTIVYCDPGAMIGKKKENSILWASKLSELKHPEAAIRVAKRLKSDGIAFSLDVIGGGELETRVSEMIRHDHLQDCVRLLGPMTSDEVRKNMEKNRIFLFNSDRHEGWGAVVNEAMNGGCAVIASDAAGAPAYLISDGTNGYGYPSGNNGDLYEKVKKLLLSKEECARIGRNAYDTITGVWNAESAAERFIALAADILSGGDGKDLYEEGPCSPAPLKKNQTRFRIRNNRSVQTPDNRKDGQI